MFDLFAGIGFQCSLVLCYFFLFHIFNITESPNYTLSYLIHPIHSIHMVVVVLDSYWNGFAILSDTCTTFGLCG